MMMRELQEHLRKKMYEIVGKTFFAVHVLICSVIKFDNVKVNCAAVKADFTQDFIVCADANILLLYELGTMVTLLFLPLLPLEPQTQTQSDSLRLSIHDHQQNHFTPA